MLEKRANAKINLFLQVLGKRPDGYHNIRTLMIPISLYDTLRFKIINKKEIILKCPGNNHLENENNLVYKAAKSLIKEKGIEIELNKNIPEGAGLGGGSSDCATTLLTLNDLFGLNKSQKELINIGAKLGADVPFFVSKKTSICEGIGEQITPLDSFPELEVLLVNPGINVSTKWAYSDLKIQLTKKSPSVTATRFVTTQNLKNFLDLCSNDLEAKVTKKFKEIVEIKSILKEHGSIFAMMSGSGATVFGIFFDQNRKIETIKKLEKNKPKWSVWDVKTLYSS